jgi:putative membrane protein
MTRMRIIMEAAMRSIPLGPAFAFLLATSPAFAQIGNPAGTEPATRESAPGVPAAHQTNPQDQLFAQQIAIGGLAEVALGKLADRKAHHRAVKEFGRVMVEDHGKANEKLKALASAAGIPLPTEPDPEHKAVQAGLEQLSGAQFDVNYLEAQVQDHQKAAQLLQWEINSGQDAQLQRFASETLPVVLRHLRMVQDLASQIAGQTPRELVPRTTGMNHQDEPKRTR